MQDLMQPISTPDGLFHDGNPATGELGTLVSALWLNAVQGAARSVQAELLSVLAAAGIALDPAKSDQVLDALKKIHRDQLATAFTSGGTASAYTLTPSPALGTLSANTRYRVKFHTANSSAASTLAVSGLAAKSIKQYDSSGAKVSAVIKASQLADVEYDGTDWVIVDPLPSGMAASSVQTFAATGTLPATVVGGTAIINSASATTQTLPAANSVSAGGRIELMNIGAGVATISRSGTDTIIPNSTPVTSLSFSQGDTLTLESNGSNAWYAVGGSAQLGYSGVFGLSLAANGYQKLPGGLILQWGSGLYTKGTSYNFPIAFPNEIFAWECNHLGTDNTANACHSALSTTAFTPVWAAPTSPVHQKWFAVGR